MHGFNKSIFFTFSNDLKKNLNNSVKFEKQALQLNVYYTVLFLISLEYSKINNIS